MKVTLLLQYTVAIIKGDLDLAGTLAHNIVDISCAITRKEEIMIQNGTKCFLKSCEKFNAYPIFQDFLSQNIISTSF